MARSNKRTASGKRRELEKQMDINMNDICPLIYICKDKTDEWRCFGRWRRCVDYIAYCREYSQTERFK